MAKKKRSFRPRYLDDFKPGATGEYEYRGTFMHCTLSEEGFRKKARKVLILVLGASALLISAGCFPGTGMEGRPLILMPYALSLIAALIAVYKAVRMLAGGGRIRTYEFKRIVPRILVSSAAGAVLCAMGIFGIVISFLTHQFAGPVYPPLLLGGCFAGAGILLALAVQEMRRLPWAEMGNKDKNE